MHIALTLTLTLTLTNRMPDLQPDPNHPPAAHTPPAVQAGRSRPGLDRLVTEQEQESALLPRACPRTQSAHVPG